MPNYANIPQRLRDRAQWVVWYAQQRGDKRTKIPHDPKTNEVASVTDPNTWGTFEQAVAACPQCAEHDGGIGYVLYRAKDRSIQSDDIVFIDLDEPKGATPEQYQAAMLLRSQLWERFEHVYWELSPSGQGAHALLIGDLPGKGRRNSKLGIEIYDNERFFTVTGNVLQGRGKLDRVDNNTLAELYQYVAPGSVAHDNTQRPESGSADKPRDEVVALLVSDPKYLALWNGEDIGHGDASAGDLALANRLAAFTKNYDQFREIIKASPRAERDNQKLRRRPDLIERLIAKSYDTPAVDTSGLMGQLQAMSAAQNIALDKFRKDAEHAAKHYGIRAGAARTLADQAIEALTQIGPLFPTGQDELPFPPGLTGRLAEFVHEQSPQPNRTISTIAAIGVMAALFGRGYHVAGEGLSHYILLIAPSSAGKEAITSGSTKVLNALAKTRPAVAKVKGPRRFASGQAFYKSLAAQGNQLVVWSEFWQAFQSWSTKNTQANESLGLLRTGILEAYTANSPFKEMQGQEYADSKNNIPSVWNPALTILGETAATNLLQTLRDSDIEDGLFSRFIVMDADYVADETGYRLDITNEEAFKAEPSDELIRHLDAICDAADKAVQARDPIEIKLAPGVAELFREYRRNAIRVVPAADKVRQALWSRAFVKVMRLSALLAVGLTNDAAAPLIDTSTVRWAASFITTATLQLATRSQSGALGDGDTAAAAKVREVLLHYATCEFDALSNAGRIKPEWHDNDIVPYAWISQMVASHSVFKKQKGEFNVLKGVLLALEQEGLIEVVMLSGSRAIFYKIMVDML